MASASAMQQLHFLTPAFADVARLLHKRTKKGQPFMRTKECDDSFLRLKEALVYAPVLAYPHMEDPYVFDTVTTMLASVPFYLKFTFSWRGKSCSLLQASTQ